LLRQDRWMTLTAARRLTQYAHGGGCACKIPRGELEGIVGDLIGSVPICRRAGAESLGGRLANGADSHGNPSASRGKQQLRGVSRS
jgi:hypothetical protein